MSLQVCPGGLQEGTVICEGVSEYHSSAIHCGVSYKLLYIMIRDGEGCIQQTPILYIYRIAV
jgi:hypothetical protein